MISSGMIMIALGPKEKMERSLGPCANDFEK
jgi:hypothetical protein